MHCQTKGLFDRCKCPSRALALTITVAALPFAAQADPFAYVTNYGSGTVSVIDTATNQPVGSPIPVNEGFPYGVAVSPDGKKVFTANDTNLPGSVSVIDTASSQLITTIPEPNGPTDLAFSIDGSRVYLVNSGSPSAPASVIVIDATTYQTTTILTGVQGQNGYQAVAVSPKGDRVYVVDGAASSVYVINTATNHVDYTISGLPSGATNSTRKAAISPDGTRLYVTNYADGSVTVIDTVHLIIADTIRGLSSPYGVTIFPDGTTLYVANAGAGTVSVINTNNDSVRTTVSGFSNPIGVSINPEGSKLFIANGASNTNAVSEIDLATGATSTIPTSPSPAFIGIIPPPRGIPFSQYSAKVSITLGNTQSANLVSLNSSFTLNSVLGDATINPITENVRIMVGNYLTTIPPGSFKQNKKGFYVFSGTINGVGLTVNIKPLGNMMYTFQATASGPNLTGTANPVAVGIGIGNDAGWTTVTASGI